MNKQKMDPENSTYNSLECEVEKKDKRQKVKTSIQLMQRVLFTGACGMVNDMAEPCVC
jgi:hypothetical protein